MTQHVVRSKRRNANAMSAGSQRTATRRRKIIAAAVGIALAALPLAGCAPTAASGAAGTLTIAEASDPGETLNPYANTSGPVEGMRDAQLYEGLTKLNPEGAVVWDLAVGMTPNAQLTQWTIKLRPHVKFTDGTPFTAKDVVASIKYIIDPKHAAGGANYLDDIDPHKVTAVNDLTVSVGLLHPFGPFKALWTNYQLYMTKAGSAPHDPIGTGPFVNTEFTPGQQSVMKRFDGYWGVKPKVSAIKILEFQTEQGQINALESGQVDIASEATPATAKSLEGKSGIKLLVDKSNYHLLISFNTSVAPFNDERVIQAMRLIIDRPQVVSVALGGFGRVANDQEGGTPTCPAPDTPQRTQDIAQAKKLLAEAGQSHLSFSIATDGAQPGMTQLVQVFSQDAAQAGVTVTLNQISTPQLLAKWDEWPSYIDYNAGPYLQTVIGNLIPGGNGNATHWDNPQFVSLANRLFQTTDPAQQCTLENEMHQIEYSGDGSIIPAWLDVVVPYRSNVSGLVGDVNGNPLGFLSSVKISG